MIFKAVIDTNVWISGLFWGGLPYKILEKVYDCKLYCCFSFDTFGEWKEKAGKLAEVSGKFGLFIRDKKLIEKNSILIFPKEKIGICRNPKDNMILETAVASKADFIITGDRDLLALKIYKTIRILTPAGFFKIQ